MFEGILPAIITPFKRNPSMDLDLEGLRSNISSLLDSGVHGIVPCGSTGESATLDFSEHEKVIEVTLDEVNGKVPVVAGTGSNNTSEALRLTRAARDMGVDGVLAISPYYNKPNRTGLVRHYQALADCDVPVVMYNVPGRTGQNLPPSWVAELACHPNIVAIKEASGDINQISQVIEMTRDEDFSVISGDDTMTLPMMSLGAVGVISVAANIAPTQMIDLYQSFVRGDYERARAIHFAISPLIRALFAESNPIPVKKAAELRGFAGGPVRLPLAEAGEETVALLTEVLAGYD